MSYNFLLSAKASDSTMYNSFQNNNNHYIQNDMAAAHANNQDDGHSDEEEEDLGYDNDNGQEGSAHSAEDAGNNSQFANFQLKRCRFSPRHDIELLRELENADEKPFLLVGKASWEAWGKIAHSLNQKQIFGPVLTLSALTCKLRLDFLLKNLNGHAMKFNAKRGTPQEFQKRDEMINALLPLIPDRGEDANGRKRRGRPRKMRFSQRFSSDDDDNHSMAVDSEMNGAHMLGASSSKRKPGRPRKISDTPGAFLDGAALADYLSSTRARSARVDLPAAVGLASPQPFLHHYMAAQASGLATGLPEGSVVTMLAEYLKRHHETDLQFKREQMETHLREKSEERRLEREKLDVQRAELETRKAELQFQREKFLLEQQERQVQLDLMRQALNSRKS